jgi:hypothetical protein
MVNSIKINKYYIKEKHIILRYEYKGHSKKEQKFQKV